MNFSHSEERMDKEIFFFITCVCKVPVLVIETYILEFVVAFEHKKYSFTHVIARTTRKICFTRQLHSRLKTIVVQTKNNSSINSPQKLKS